MYEIKKQGGKWVVKEKDGKIIGIHHAEKDAKAQIALMSLFFGDESRS